MIRLLRVSSEVVLYLVSELLLDCNTRYTIQIDRDISCVSIG